MSSMVEVQPLSGKVIGFAQWIQQDSEHIRWTQHQRRSVPAGKEAEAYVYTSTRARAGKNPLTRPCGPNLRAPRHKRRPPPLSSRRAGRDDCGELIGKWEVGGDLLPVSHAIEYEECGGAGQTQMWFTVFEVQRRLLAERVIWLGLIGQGYGQVRFVEPCSCGTSHCEYHWVRPGGSLEEIETIACECLAIIKEPTVIRKNLRPRRRYYFKCLSGSIRWNNNTFRDMKCWDPPGDDAPTIQREHPGSAKARRIPISRTEAIAMARQIAKRGNCGCAGGGREYRVSST
ncbi:hypothetical protein B0H14DRAFT_2597836 [Mycena olivaceomarginata]|nr:hypothetical protein B0H14DRAFT_2597836 [Mycena olivaceomarginata]